MTTKSLHGFNFLGLTKGFKQPATLARPQPQKNQIATQPQAKNPHIDENGRYKNSFQSSGEINKTPAMTIVSMQALLRAGEVDKARARAESVLSTNKNHRDALLTLARLALVDGDRARAEEFLNRATKSGVEDTDSRLVRAALATEKGDLDGARAIYTQVILESTQNPRAEAHFGLGFLLAAEEDFPGARKSLQRAVELEPKVAAYRFHLARILFALEELKLALPQLERALELNPLHPPTYVIWSVVLQQLGEMETAEDLLRQGLKLIPDHPELLNQLSAVLAARGKEV